MKIDSVVFDSEISEFEGFDDVSVHSVPSVPVFTFSNSAVLVSNFVVADFAGEHYALSENSADFNAVLKILHFLRIRNL